MVYCKGRREAVLSLVVVGLYSKMFISSTVYEAQVGLTLIVCEQHAAIDPSRVTTLQLSRTAESATSAVDGQL